VAWPVTGVFFGLAKGLSAGPAAGVLAGVLQGLDVALIIGSAYLFQSPDCPADPHALAPLGRLPPLIRTPAIAVLCAKAPAWLRREGHDRRLTATMTPQLETGSGGSFVRGQNAVGQLLAFGHKTILPSTCAPCRTATRG